MKMFRVAGTGEVEEGEAKRVLVDGRPVALVRTAGRLYAVDDTCTHEEASLSDGFIEDGKIECPRHGAMFDLATGSALSLPATRDIGTWVVKVEGDDILVGREE